MARVLIEPPKEARLAGVNQEGDDCESADGR